MMKKGMVLSLALIILLGFAEAAQAIPARGAINPLYHQLYLPNNNEGKIYTWRRNFVTSPSANDWIKNTSVTINLPSGAKSYGLAVSEDGSKLFVAIASPAAIRVYPLTNGIPTPATYTTLSWSPPTGSSLAEIAVVGSRLYAVNNGANRVEFFNFSAGSWSHGSFFLGGEAQLFGIAATADRIFVSQKANSGKVFIYDASTLDPYGNPITGLKNPTYLKISPLSGRIYIAVNDTLVSPDGNDVVVYRTVSSDGDNDLSDELVGAVKSGITGPYGWTGIDLSPTDATNANEYLYFTQKTSSGTSVKLYRKAAALISGTVTADYVSELTSVLADSVTLSPDRSILAATLSDNGTLFTLATNLGFAKPVIDSITPEAVKHTVGNSFITVTITGRNFASSEVIQSKPVLAIDAAEYPFSIKNYAVKSAGQIVGEINCLWGDADQNKLSIGIYDAKVKNKKYEDNSSYPDASAVRADAFAINLPEPTGFAGNSPAYIESDGVVENGNIRWTFDWLDVGEEGYNLSNQSGGATYGFAATEPWKPGVGKIDETYSTRNVPVSRYLKIYRALGGYKEITDQPVTVYSSCGKPLSFQSTGKTATSITLSWNPNLNPAGTTYEVKRVSPAPSQTFTTTETTFTDTNLTTGTAYTYQARAVNYAGYPTNWTAPGLIVKTNSAPDNPTALGPAKYVNGSWNNDSTPTLNFQLSDPDTADHVKYRIQIDDTADFGSLVVDYTSSSASQGTRNFTVGMAVGGGAYAVGASGQTLPDGSYYWKVKCIDEWSAESDWTPAASGDAVAFGLDTLAPTITSVFPAENSSGAAATSTVEAVFSDDMDASTITGTNFTLKQGSIPIPAAVAYDSANKKALLDPNADLSYNTTYTATVKTGVKDKAGNPLAAQKLWVFTTQAPPNQLPNDFDLLYPQNNTTASATPTLSWEAKGDPDGDTVTYEVTIIRDDTTLLTKANITNNYYQVQPADASLAAGETYTWKVTAYDGKGSTKQSTHTWTFTVGSDVLGNPTIIQTIPADQQENVPIDAPVKVFFSEPMDQATVNAVYPALINGWAVLWSPDSKSVTYTHNLFTADASYAFQISGGKDFAFPGNNLTAGSVPNPWNFRTNVSGALNQPPNSPALDQPADGANVTTTPTLSWTAASPVDPNDTSVTYRVEVAEDAAFTTILTKETVSGTTYAVPSSAGVTLGHGYHWRVFAVDPWGAETVSTPASRIFWATVAEPPQAPTGLMVTKLENDAILTWLAPATGPAPEKYRVYRGTSIAELQGNVASHTFLTEPSGTSHTDNGVVAPADTNSYYYYVTSLAGGQESLGTSNMGYLLKTNLTIEPLAISNMYWVAIPFNTSYQKARDIANDINGSLTVGDPGTCVEVGKFDTASGATETLSWYGGSDWYDISTEDDQGFSITAGESYYVSIVGTTYWLPAGSDNPAFEFDLTPAGTNIYWISLPYNSDYAKAKDIVDHINQGSDPENPIVTEIGKFDPNTGATETLSWYGGSDWYDTLTGDDQGFNFAQGEGYYISVFQPLNNWMPKRK